MNKLRTLAYVELEALSRKGEVEAKRELLIRDYQQRMDYLQDEGILGVGNPSIVQCREIISKLLSGDDPEKWNY